MQRSSQVPSVVDELITNSIHSIEELEILLLLHRERPRRLTLGEIHHELRITIAAAQAALNKLAGNGLVAAVEGAFTYLPARQAAAVDELARTYKDYRVETLVLISSRALDRVRLSALKTFAEAFRFKNWR